MADATPGIVTFHVRRFEPGKDEKPRWEDHPIEVLPGMTVLDGLWKVKELSAPGLACNTQIAELGSDIVAVAPLPNFDIIKDLVPDLRPMFEAHRELLPYLLRDDTAEQEDPTREYRQSPHELEEYLQFSYCIKCGCCMAACPTVATDALYAGPMPLGQAHRYDSDTRDGGFAQRRDVLSGGSGPWRCHFAGECSQVCPKGVDPAKAIQLMKRPDRYLHGPTPRPRERPARRDAPCGERSTRRDPHTTGSRVSAGPERRGGSTGTGPGGRPRRSGRAGRPRSGR